MRIVDAKELSLKVEEEIRQELEQYCSKPELVVIQANEDPASDLYINNKIKACERVGIKHHHMKVGKHISANQLISMIESLNISNCIHGILLQLPLHSHLKQDEQRILQSISPKKDVDCFTYENLGKMAHSEGNIKPLTAKGVIDILKFNNVEIEGKHAVVLGRSLVSGKSVADLLLKENATVTICHSKTKDLISHTRNADILVCCMGQPKIIKHWHLKDDVALVNVGFAKDENGKTCGDIDFDDIVEFGIPSLMTKIFNTSGTMTVTNLMKSTLECFKNQQQCILGGIDNE